MAGGEEEEGVYRRNRRIRVAKRVERRSTTRVRDISKKRDRMGKLATCVRDCVIEKLSVLYASEV